MGWRSTATTSDYITAAELERVYAILSPQHRIIVSLMEHTGLRVGDVITLRTEQLSQRCYIRESKTGKTRRVYIPAGLLAQIKAQAGPVWAFPGRKPGTHITRQAVWAEVKRAAKAYRLKCNLSPHSLRKYYAVRLYAKYGDIGKVAKVLGHSNPETTLIYAMADKLRDARMGPSEGQGGHGPRRNA